MKLTKLKQILRRPFDFNWKGKEEPEIASRRSQIQGKAKRKQNILNAGIQKANAQEARRKIERQQFGHIITPLHR